MVTRLSLAAAFLIAVAACAAGTSSQGRPTTHATSTAGAADASSEDGAAASPSGTSIPPGAAVSSPVFSADLCEQDSDCHPLATCHPNVCVLAEHRGTLPVGMMCTEACFPLTLDCGYNRCACVAGDAGAKKCAMVSGATSD